MNVYELVLAHNEAEKLLAERKALGGFDANAETIVKILEIQMRVIEAIMFEAIMGESEDEAEHDQD